MNARDDDPVSLAPLTPAEALRALLAVRPDDPPVGEQPGGSADDGGEQPSSSAHVEG